MHKNTNTNTNYQRHKYENSGNMGSLYPIKGIVLNSRELIFSLNRTLVGSDVLCKIQAAGGMAVDHNMSMYELNFISTMFDEWTLLC